MKKVASRLAALLPLIALVSLASLLLADDTCTQQPDYNYSKCTVCQNRMGGVKCEDQGTAPACTGYYSVGATPVQAWDVLPGGAGWKLQSALKQDGTPMKAACITWYACGLWDIRRNPPCITITNAATCESPYYTAAECIGPPKGG